MTCKWKKPWVGGCLAAPIGDTEYCSEHQHQCRSCRAPATHGCDETGQFVCGAPLCDDCEHALFPDGSNGGVGFNSQPCPDGMRRHCKKTEQKYKAWYERADQPEVSE